MQSLKNNKQGKNVLQEEISRKKEEDVTWKKNVF